VFVSVDAVRCATIRPVLGRSVLAELEVPFQARHVHLEGDDSSDYARPQSLVGVVPYGSKVWIEDGDQLVHKLVRGIAVQGAHGTGRVHRDVVPGRTGARIAQNRRDVGVRALERDQRPHVTVQ